MWPRADSNCQREVTLASCWEAVAGLCEPGRTFPKESGGKQPAWGALAPSEAAEGNSGRRRAGDPGPDWAPRRIPQRAAFTEDIALRREALCRLPGGGAGQRLRGRRRSPEPEREALFARNHTLRLFLLPLPRPAPAAVHRGRATFFAVLACPNSSFHVAVLMFVSSVTFAGCVALGESVHSRLFGAVTFHVP